jgi:large subunit ribosomal protein L6
MSRIGKQLITIPQGVEATFAGGVFRAKGPKGTLERIVPPVIGVTIHDDVVTVAPVKETDTAPAQWGTAASHIVNMFEGVTAGFEKKLEIEGVGFRAEVQGSNLVLAVGFSHPVRLAIPEGATVAIEKNVITVSGYDKEAVGQFAANVRATKKPEPYKGKGIHYIGEYIIRKQGKKAV